MSSSEKTQSYFSALARGGLVAALHYTQNGGVGIKVCCFE